MKTPSSCYEESYRRWDGILRPPEYDRNVMDVRKVLSRGSISFSAKFYYIGEALVNEYVGLKTVEKGEIEVYYGPIYLGKLTDGAFERPTDLEMKRKYPS